jgi:hypothetical protein
MWKLFYLADVVDTLNTALGWLVALSVILFVITLIWRLIYRFDNYNYDIDSEKDKDGDPNADRLQYLTLQKLNRVGLIAFFIFITLKIATPSKNTIYLMAGGKLVDLTIENNPQIKEVPGKTIDLLNAWLEKETEGLKPKENIEKKVGE